MIILGGKGYCVEGVTPGARYLYVGADSAWVREKPEARKLLKKRGA